MPFGKHEGEAMANVPDSYLIWLRDNASNGVRKRFPEPQTIVTARKDEHFLNNKDYESLYQWKNNRITS